MRWRLRGCSLRLRGCRWRLRGCGGGGVFEVKGVEVEVEGMVEVEGWRLRRGGG